MTTCHNNHPLGALCHRLISLVFKFIVVQLGNQILSCIKRHSLYQAIETFVCIRLSGPLKLVVYFLWLHCGFHVCFYNGDW